MPLITDKEKSMLRIRKLTPKECLRLMGFTDEDYQAMRDIGMSDAAIYHMAGDSLVVPVFMAIMYEMVCHNQDGHIEKIREYIKNNVVEK